MIECRKLHSLLAQGNLAMRLLLSLIFSLLLLGSSAAHAQSVSGGELARTGEFFGKFVAAKSGEVWLGLYQVGDEYELRSATVIVNERDSVMGMLKEVQTNQPTEPLFLVRGLEALQPGKVETMSDDNKFLYPGETKQLRSASGYYVLVAGGEVVPRRSEALIKKYMLTLYGGSLRRTQTLVDFEVGIDGARPGLIWAGDLDKDGEFDLYMTVSRHYAYVDFALFLSSAAKDGEIVGQVARWGASVD